VALVRDAGVPTVMVERYPPVEGVAGIRTDERAGSRQAVEHLAALGHRRLGYVGLADLHPADRERFRGAVEAAAELGVELAPEWVYRRRDQDAAATYAFVRHLLAQPRRPTAIYAGGNLFAIEVLRAARDAGLRVPEDLSVLSFDDQYAELTYPRLTTVATPARVLGQTAVDLLMQLLEPRHGAPPPPPETVVLPRLTVRESTAPAP
jgi:LacI family transcriptional regulator